MLRYRLILLTSLILPVLVGCQGPADSQLRMKLTKSDDLDSEMQRVAARLGAAKKTEFEQAVAIVGAEALQLADSNVEKNPSNPKAALDAAFVEAFNGKTPDELISAAQQKMAGKR